MALRFPADHCVSNSTVQSLRETQHEVLRLKDVLPVESSDTIVIAKAQEWGCGRRGRDGDRD
jgi:biotin-(acetyl-CoA carboxylase) ligase